MKFGKTLVGKFLRAILGRLGYLVLANGEVAGFQSALAATGRVAVRLRQFDRSGEGGQRETQDDVTNLRSVIFSKDRPLQLAALLGGYLECFDAPPACDVLYTASNPRMEGAYQQVRAEIEERRSPAGTINFRRERDFRTDLLDLLDRPEATDENRVFFLVDDIVFLEPVRVADLLNFPLHSHILSLRLAPRITYSYTRSLPERSPALQTFLETTANDAESLLEWSWAEGEIDWGYAFSVDGHVFCAAEILELARAVQFRAPNSFESAMQVYAPYFASRRGLCYARPKLVNIPCNRVQTEVANLHGELHPERLLEQFEAGDRVDFAALYGFENNSCHEEIELPLRPGPKYSTPRAPDRSVGLGLE